MCFEPEKNTGQYDNYFWLCLFDCIFFPINVLFSKYEKIFLNFQFFGSWPTKYTAAYVTLWRPKLRRQFPENLVLWIYEFLFNFGDGISKEKNSGSSENSKFKNDRNFQLTAYLITLFFLFVINKQVKTSAEAAIKIGVPREKIKKQGKSLENNFDRVQLLVKLFAVGL